jgi:hypothetical protein
MQCGQKQDKAVLRSPKRHRPGWKTFGAVIFLPLVCMSNGKPFKNFDDFHSNLGEIRIVQHTQVSDQAHSSKSSSPRNALPPVGFSSAKEDEEPILTLSDQKENTTLPVLALTDEEIDDLLFGEFNDLESEETEIIEESDWLQFYLVELGTGYADNPLYAAYNPESSGYADLSAESFWVYQPNTSQKALLYFYGEGKKFFDLDEQDSSGLFLALFDHSYQAEGLPLSFGQKLQHTYYNQGMDFSDLGTSNRMKITSNKSQFSARMEWEDDKQMKAVWELGIGRGSLREFPDQSTDLALGFTLGKKGNRWMDWEGKYFHKTTDYKDRNAKDGSGTEVDGKVKLRETGASFSLKPTFENRFSQGTKVKAGFARARNGNGGYYDFNRWKVSISKDIEIDSWESTFSLGYKSTEYLERLTDKNEKFEKNGWNVDLRISRKIHSYWKTFASWMHEEDQSNDPDYSYQSNFWSLGLSWEK